ncbi:hypothetical protein ACTXT7_015391, partial [Hymenolepis weldensis]
ASVYPIFSTLSLWFMKRHDRSINDITLESSKVEDCDFMEPICLGEKFDWLTGLPIVADVTRFHSQSRVWKSNAA